MDRVHTHTRTLRIHDISPDIGTRRNRVVTFRGQKVGQFPHPSPSSGKKVTYANPYSNHYAAQGEKTLVDGARGGWMYNDDRWQGFIDCDFDVTIDLGKETDIKQVCAEFIQLKGPYVWLPKQVIISSSVDGEHYDILATVDNDISPDIETLQFKEFGWEGNAKTRYIRYKALSNGIAGGWLFTDEIRVK